MKRKNLITLNLQHFAAEPDPTPELNGDPEPTPNPEDNGDPEPDPEPNPDEGGATLDKPIGKPDPKSPDVPTLEELQAKIAELTAANTALHKSVNKASTDAADWKKKYQSKLSVDEQKIQAQREQEKYTKAIEKELAVLKSTIVLQSNGFGEEEAKAISEARYSGDLDEAIKLENKHYENIRQQLEADYKKKVTELTRPASGNSGVDYNKMYATAMSAGDRTGAIAALLKQAGMTTT